MKVRKIIGWNVRKIRVSLGYSIEHLAGEAEIDESHVARIERAAVNSSVDVLERLAKALRVKIAELFIEPPPGSPAPKPLKSGRRSKLRTG